MLQSPFRITVILLACCLAGVALSKTPPAKPLLSAPIQVSIPTAPDPFRTDGGRHLAYEIQFTNWGTAVWAVERLDVRGNTGAALLGVEGKALGGLLRYLGRTPEDPDRAAGELAPGESMIAFVWIDLPVDGPVPDHLYHRFRVRQSGDTATREIDAPAIVVSTQLREIAAPLRGENWLAVNGPSNVSHHRRAMLVLDGTPHIAQRYAIDWVKLGKDLKSFHGDPKDNRNYWCFGVDALAVGDGRVVEVRDGIPENEPNAPPILPVTLDTVAGNHINLDLGGGVYALYAHLQPGSLRVKMGDRVRRGQILASVGNTGNSSEPHLHFQLMDGNSPLASEGLPYVLPDYEETKRIVGEFPNPTAMARVAAIIHRGEMPSEMQLVDFQ